MRCADHASGFAEGRVSTERYTYNKILDASAPAYHEVGHDCLPCFTMRCIAELWASTAANYWLAQFSDAAAKRITDKAVESDKAQDLLKRGLHGPAIATAGAMGATAYGNARTLTE